MAKHTARLIFDNADRYGYPAQFGYGRDWVFPASRQQHPSAEGTWQPQWAHSDTEIIPGLDLLGLRGTAIPANQSLDMARVCLMQAAS